jgi:hypothetical protein
MKKIKLLTTIILLVFLNLNVFAETPKTTFPKEVKDVGTFVIPQGWVIYEDTDLEKKVENEALDLYWKVEAEYKEDYVSDDVKGYLKTILGNFKSNLVGMKSSEITETMIDGKTGYVAEVSGGLNSGVKYAYHLVALDTDDKFIMLMGWAIPSRFRKHKSTLVDISQSVKWNKK